ncbi:toprim domain-containing protein [Acidithiobacillus sp.]
MILCESSIDALSKAQMDGRHPGDVYVSIGGTPSAAAEKSLSALIRKNEPQEVVLAFDNDDAGRGFAIHMVRYLAHENQKFHMPMINTRMEFPPDEVKDWNDMLKPKAPARNQDRAREAGLGMGG